MTPRGTTSATKTSTPVGGASSAPAAPLPTRHPPPRPRVAPGPAPQAPTRLHASTAAAQAAPVGGQVGRDPRRVALEDLQPSVDGGDFPAKRVVGDAVLVEVDVLCDSHDRLAGRLLHKALGHERRPDVEGLAAGPVGAWSTAPLRPRDNDRWQGSFRVERVGWHAFTVEAWPDRLRSWVHDHRRRVEAGQDVRPDLEAGAVLVEAAAQRATAASDDVERAAEDADLLRGWAARLRAAAASAPPRAGPASGPSTPAGANGKRSPAHANPGRTAAVPTEGLEPEAPALPGPALSPGLDSALLAVADQYPDDSRAVRHPVRLLWVDGERARASAWYEMFPRSASPDPKRRGTLRDVIARLPYVAGMGFDVLYLPPIHPIGTTNRKGRNNAKAAQPGDVGSPWAIGSPAGGHTAVHPELGTLDDYRELVREAKRHGIDVAFDLALQCSPDHPWVLEHPDWFRRRPDGTIPSAENPPKKYEDIVALDFECDDWRGLWDAVLGVVLFWVDNGVRLFRVDNPHTKPFAFWHWLIAEVQARHPDVLFLSEAFTRPKVMARLAKVGFSHSYTYFAWRNGKGELQSYIHELGAPRLRDVLRPHLWPNTPDILTDLLQRGGRTANASRLVLAATLSANYGIYGPVFELAENRGLTPGREDYLDSEKYEVRHWDLDRPGDLRDLVTRLNRVRRVLPALRRDDGLHFHHVDNDQLLVYSRHADGEDAVLVCVNLDPVWAQRGFTHLDLARLGVGPGEVFEVHDVLNGPAYTWKGPRNYVELDPQRTPAHVFRLRRTATGGP